MKWLNLTDLRSAILTDLPKGLPDGKVQELLESARGRGWDGLLKTLEQGVATTLVAALDCMLEPNGAYLLDCRVAETSELARQEDKADELWELSERIVCEKFC